MRLYFIFLDNDHSHASISETGPFYLGFYGKMIWFLKSLSLAKSVFEVPLLIFGPIKTFEI